MVWVEVRSNGAGYSFNWREVPNFGPYCSKCGAYVGTASAEKLRTEMEKQVAQSRQES